MDTWTREAISRSPSCAIWHFQFHFSFSACHVVTVTNTRETGDKQTAMERREIWSFPSRLHIYGKSITGNIYLVLLMCLDLCSPYCPSWGPIRKQNWDKSMCVNGLFWELTSGHRHGGLGSVKKGRREATTRSHCQADHCWWWPQSCSPVGLRGALSTSDIPTG